MTIFSRDALALLIIQGHLQSSSMWSGQYSSLSDQHFCLILAIHYRLIPIFFLPRIYPQELDVMTFK